MLWALEVPSLNGYHEALLLLCLIIKNNIMDLSGDKHTLAPPP